LGHGITSVCPTDTYLYINHSTTTPANGSPQITGIGKIGYAYGLGLKGIIVTNTYDVPAILISSSKANGTALQAVGDNEKSVCLENHGITSITTYGDGRVKTHSGRILKIRRVLSGPDTILATDHNIIYVTATGNWVVNLPAGIEGTEYIIIVYPSSCGYITLTPYSGEVLFGSASPYDLYGGQEVRIIYSFNDGWIGGTWGWDWD
jgi:hypothetical protein